MTKDNFTKQQQTAICSTGSDMLVTASAGTGKTFVLSQRCADILAQTNTSPDQLLVMTFTEAAAEEMKTRISKTVKQLYSKTKNPRLKYQLLLLPQADISTIHAFCKKIITEYFTKLDIDPAFEVIDTDERTLIRSHCLEQTIETAWQRPDLAQAMLVLLDGRNPDSDSGFLNNILNISEFLDNLPSAQNWLNSALEFTTPAAQAKLKDMQTSQLKKNIDQIIRQCEHAFEIYLSAGGDNEWIQKSQKATDPLYAARQKLKENDLKSCADIITQYIARTSAPKDIDPELADILKLILKEAVDKFKALADLATLNTQYLQKMQNSIPGQTRLIVELVKIFNAAYAARKKQLGCVDFADLEHLALKLLTVDISNPDICKPSQVALELRNNYKYIFVDEYQDINPVQKLIIDMVRSGNNLFAVGDVKQSIYGFRGAEPQIFLDHLKEASPTPSPNSTAQRVDLNQNFRSDPGILNFANTVFEKIMTKSIAGLDYDENAKMTPSSAPRPDQPTPAVELCILEKTNSRSSTDTDQPDDIAAASNRQRQAIFTARRINQIVKNCEFNIFDKNLNQYRPPRYSDIAILMRSPSKKVNDYIETLNLYGIPVTCSDSTGFFETTEITDILALLKVLDNPKRDIEFASVLRSPFFNFTDSDLTELALNTKKISAADLYQSAVEFAAHDCELAERLRAAIATIKKWQQTARRAIIADLIWQIYTQTNILGFVSALPNPAARKANLLKLHERAIQFENFVSSASCPSLARFIEFLEKLREKQQDWSSAEPPQSSKDTVRIMSIHKSKGLEFPVVFIVELDTNFKSPEKNDILIDNQLTLGMQHIEKESNLKINSPLYQLISDKHFHASLAEEMRILYVALTRPQHKLILIGSQSRKLCSQRAAEGLYIESATLPDFQITSCKNHLQWLLLSLAKSRSLHQQLNTGLENDCENYDTFSPSFYPADQLTELDNEFEKLLSAAKTNFCQTPAPEASAEKTKQIFEKIKKSVNYKYPYSAATELPAKYTVTELTKQTQPTYEHRTPANIPAAHSADSAAAIGTATHLLIAKLDLQTPITPETITAKLEQLSQQDLIRPETKSLINIDGIAAFFQFPLGKQILSADKIYREWQFTTAVPAAQLTNNTNPTPDETVILQGIIDILAIKDNQLTVIDIKTDRITEQQIPERAEKYKKQLELYAQAAQSIFKTKTKDTKKYLYFLTPKKPFHIK